MSEQAYQDPLHVRLRRMAEHAPAGVTSDVSDPHTHRLVGSTNIPIRPLIEEAADELERLTKRIPMTDVNELEKLSAEASKGLLQFEEGSSYALPSGEYVQPCCINEDGETVFDEMYPADGRFVMALWNAYRSGALVPTGSDAWRDISTAPRDGTTVLLYPAPYLGWNGVVGHWASKAKRWNAQTGDGWVDPTHWKPITPPHATPSPDPRDAEIARLKEALGETRTDLVILEGSAHETSKTNHRWEGMTDSIRGWINRIDAALNGGRDA